MFLITGALSPLFSHSVVSSVARLTADSVELRVRWTVMINGMHIWTAELWMRRMRNEVFERRMRINGEGE
jgi:hypothetical protein